MPTTRPSAPVIRTGAPAARRVPASMRTSPLSAVRPIKVWASAPAAVARIAPTAAKKGRAEGVVTAVLHAWRGGPVGPRCRRYGGAAPSDATAGVTESRAAGSGRAGGGEPADEEDRPRRPPGGRPSRRLQADLDQHARLRPDGAWGDGHPPLRRDQPERGRGRGALRQRPELQHPIRVD